MKQVYTRDSVIGVKGGAVAARLARRRNVVFPEPEGAMMQTTSPASTSKVTFSRARTLPKRFPTGVGNGAVRPMWDAYASS
jgi:hypothetical protein